MSDRMKRLRRVFNTAEAEVDASKKRLRELSAARLAELSMLPPQRRIAALDDPALTALDRTTLRQSIEDAFPKRIVHVQRRWTGVVRIMGRLAWYRRQGFVLFAIATGPIGFFAISGWLHTLPENAVPVAFAVPLSTTWAMADGSSYTAPDPDPVGTQAVWFRKGATGTLRRWFPRRGYGWINVVPDDLLTNRQIVLR